MSENHNPKISIVVVPRERFSLVQMSVEHLYAFTCEPFEVIVVDCNSPNAVFQKLKKWESNNSNFKVLRTEKFLYPYEAKNLAVLHVSKDSKWVVFIDNDVKVSPHWLDELLRAAEETGVRVLHPLYLIEQIGKEDVSIHMADGLIKSGQKNGKRVFQLVMNYVGLNICNISKFVRKESELLEFHTFMIRRDLLCEMGQFEPFMLSEDANYSLRLRAKGERIIFEPRSVITYVVGPPFEKYDLPYFRFRWNTKLGEESSQILRKRWPDVLDAYWDSKNRWMHFHRSRIEPWHFIVERYNAVRAYSRTARRLGGILPILNKM